MVVRTEEWNRQDINIPYEQDSWDVMYIWVLICLMIHSRRDGPGEEVKSGL